MRLELIPYEPGICGDFAEFYPGGNNGPPWAKESVYMAGNVFNALDRIVGGFDPSAPMTFSGRQLDQLIEDLESAAKRISNAKDPIDLWADYWTFDFIDRDTAKEWQEVRREFSLMLRELVSWIRSVKARGEPLTVHAV